MIAREMVIKIDIVGHAMMVIIVSHVQTEQLAPSARINYRKIHLAHQLTIICSVWILRINLMSLDVTLKIFAVKVILKRLDL